MPNRLPRQPTTLPWESPPCLLSSTTAAWASGPSCEAAGPRAAEGCRGGRPRSRFWQRRQRPTWTLNCRWMGSRGISTWYWWATWVSTTGPPQPGQASGRGCLVDLVDVGGWPPMGLGAVIRAGLAAGPLRLGPRRPFGKRSGLALAGAEGRVELTAKALVLGLQGIDPPREGLTVGTPGR